MSIFFFKFGVPPQREARILSFVLFFHFYSSKTGGITDRLPYTAYRKPVSLIAAIGRSDAGRVEVQEAGTRGIANSRRPVVPAATDTEERTCGIQEAGVNSKPVIE